MSIKETETKVVTYLDEHAKAARIAGWVLAGMNAVAAGAALLRPDWIMAAFNVVTAIVLVWLLVKTRKVVVPPVIDDYMPR